jgi:predicted O-methyltransferase YrrM
MPGRPTGPLPRKPPLPKEATAKLETIAGGTEVLEYGSGGSTLFFSDIGAIVISIEHHEMWADQVRSQVKDNSFVEIKVVPRGEIGTTVPDGEFDVVFVDCAQEQRAPAIKLSKNSVRVGGWMVVDDYNFPEVRQAVCSLSDKAWDKTIVTGHKMHPIRKEMVQSQVAFCRRR